MEFDIGTLKNDKLYDIQYCASPSQYHNILSTIGSMIRSFKIEYLDNKVIITGESRVWINEK
jgi:hypothetical protein